MLRPVATFAFALFASSLIGAGVAEAQNARSQARPTQDNDSIVPQARTEKQFPLGSAWTVISINNKPISGERPTLIVDDQLRGKGFAGCNTYSATAYPLREQGFAVGPVAVTRKACDGAASANERAFLVALRGARKWDMVNGQIVIQGVAGEIRFERAL
jgi:heat shock protein HslJ